MSTETDLSDNRFNRFKLKDGKHSAEDWLSISEKLHYITKLLSDMNFPV
jgi:hypothetical protein